MSTPKSSGEVRETFLSYFESRDHRRVKSSSLVPENDPTLLFTNAGMNQFKDTFLGIEQRDYRRATTSQKCMRVSGKHNDLETVGRTARHHTFFEMLGNFSFGDYFKREAIEFAWELCTAVYGLPTDRLLITIFREDDEAHQLWKGRIGVPEDRIFRMGEKDNFWAMGETGPCGPCSEIHYDFGRSPLGHEGCTLECDCGRYVELWNLVFMQFSRDSSGNMEPLPSPSIDTGMGLERVTCVLQGMHSNYDTDLFRPLIDEAARRTQVAYGENEESDISLRILADHSRASAFLVADGILPGNEGRGYVLRKILRRAIRHGKMLGRDEPFIFGLVALVADLMKDAYPELEGSREYSARIVRSEEEKFSATLHHGMAILNDLTERVTASDRNRLPGDELFRLYDTYGFPLDLVREVAQERNLVVDEEGFRVEMEKQRERARASWKEGDKAVRPIFQELAGRGLQTEFTGYRHQEKVTGEVLALLRDDRIVEELKEGETGEVILSRTPLYAEAGGQVSDHGFLESGNTYARVEHVFTPLPGLRLHRVDVKRGRLKLGDQVQTSFDKSLRFSTERNHTATHLLHAALREILGEHVKQSGSLVAPEKLRFDFSHYRPVTVEELRGVEGLVNAKIRENLEVQTEIRDLEEAIRGGAMALFGEKYSQRVRVVSIPDFSQELCGGTHVQRTGEIALFKVVGEGSISSGVRRVEAVTGERAIERFVESEEILGRLSQQVRSRREELIEAVEKLQRELKQAQRRQEELQHKLAESAGGAVLAEARQVKGVQVLARRVENLEGGSLRTLAEQLRNRLKSGVVVLGRRQDGRVNLVAMVSADLTDRIQANQLIQEIAPIVDGRGGGRPDMAEAGGKNPERLAEALELTYEVVSRSLT